MRNTLSLILLGSLVLSCSFFVLLRRIPSSDVYFRSAESVLISNSFFNYEPSQSSLNIHTPPSRIPLSSSDTQKDGSFNGFDLKLVTATGNIHSRVHCVGENYLEDAWKHRSCHFEFLCFNTSSSDFVVFQAENEATLLKEQSRLPFWYLSSTLSRNSSVSIGSLNSSWTDDEINSLEWFPKVLPSSFIPSTYFALPPTLVLAPLFSGHDSLTTKLMDDILPIYTLLDMFSLKERHVLPIRGVMDHTGSKNAPKESRCSPTDTSCQEDLDSLAGLLWDNAHRSSSLWNYSSVNDFELDTHLESAPDLVCSQSGVAGFGPLTDHTVKANKKMVLTHNHGRGGLFQRFRNYVLRNLNIPIQLKPSKKIVWALSEVHAPAEIAADGLPLTGNKEWAGMELVEKIEILSSANILVADRDECLLSIFLPPEATLIIVDSEHAHWDLINNLSHIWVHWVKPEEIDTREAIAVCPSTPLCNIIKQYA